MFTATSKTSASPERVLDVLTDPAAIRTWSPVPFEVEGLEGSRLESGSAARVSGRLGGLGVGFEVHVRSADHEVLDLVATGPVDLDVRYDLVRAEEGSEVRASVSVRRASGLGGRVVAKATEALLAGGALQGAAARIARAAESGAPVALAH